ncbi:MAG: SDR family oxidoreductase [Bacteroidales bacterium]|nr:SDR family oxidoreductase [Bacteroidales bacterium]
MTQSKILITGATGNVGKQLVERIAKLDVPFRALVRSGSNHDYLKDIPQVEIVTGDLADRQSLSEALKGIEKAFLLTNSSEQAEELQLNFVNAAREAGVKHIVKLSQFAADVDSPVRFLRYHAKVENQIKEFGIDYTFLHPNLYMQGFLAFKDYIKNDGVFYASVGDASVSVVDTRDIAAIAALSLTEEGHENKIYNITGPQSLTHYELAETFSEVLGRKVSFINVSDEQMAGALKAAGFPEWQAGGLIEDYAHYARGEASAIYDTVKEVTGTEAITFKKFVQDYKGLFS